MSLQSFRIFFITMIAVSVGVLSSALPAIAASRAITQRYTSVQRHHILPSTTTINTTDPILLIHGVRAFNSNINCDSYWNNTEQYLRGTHTVAGQQIHWTGPLVRIGYYTSDNSNCYDNLAKLNWPHCKGYEDLNLGTTNESIKHLACELAWYIYSNYTYSGKNVEVIGHSMGGLLIRWALTCSTASTTKIAPCTSPSNTNPFPDAKLLVRDAVDFDTPNGGIDPKLLDVGLTGYKLGNILGCTYNSGTWICPAEVLQMETGSSFMQELNNSAQNPQGAKGTLWTLMGVTKGTSCLSLPPTVTTYMDGGNKVEYTYPCYSHITISALKDYAMMDDPPPTDTLSGVVKYCNQCSKSPTTWQSSSLYPHALLRTLYALTEQPIFHNGEFFVTTTTDLASPCTAAAYSLRCAITQANNDGKGDTIKFGIPSSDSGCKLTSIQGKSVYVCTITPTSSVPQLLASNTTIDGYTQLRAQKNTLTFGNGDNAILTVRIDGSKGVGGLVVSGNAANDTIQGLEITNFNYGILLFPSTVTNTSIVGNFIGTDGVNALGNNVGIYVSNATSNTIGGVTSATANLVSGNKQEGILIGAGFGETIEGNYIGTDRSGSTALRGSTITHVPPPLNSLGIPNGAGVYVFASSFNTFIGSTAPNAANIIAHNTYGIVTDGGRGTDITANKISSNYIGVYVQNGEFEDRIFQNTIYNNSDAGILVGNSSTDNARVSIKQNSIYGNGGLGIDLSPQDTVNCSGPVSGAPNDYQPCPIIQSVTTTQVSGTATPNSFVEVYLASNEADDQGHGEGKTFLGGVYADTNGNWSLSVSLTSGNVVTAAATLTTQGVGETSEFAVNVTLT